MVSRPPYERVMARTERLPNGCLLWTGPGTGRGGYGRVSVPTGGTEAVHRVVFEHHHGPIAAGAEIDPLCFMRRCVEITHLEAVTHAENVRRALARQTTCAQGHALVEPNIKWTNGAKGYRLRRCRTCYNATRRRTRLSRAKVPVGAVSADG